MNWRGFDCDFWWFGRGICVSMIVRKLKGHASLVDFRTEQAITCVFT